MDHFDYRQGTLRCEEVALADIAAAVGTPVYVYSHATLTRHARVFAEGLADVARKHIAFAVKSNPNLAVLKVLAREGYGADVVSGGEMDRALAAGMAPASIVFSGVGKTRVEMAHALKAGIGQFNLESEEEGVELAAIAAEMGLTAEAALRINPDVDAGTHGKISTGKAENKFGVAYDRAAAIYARLAALPGLNMRGLAVHIGSQLASIAPLEAAFKSPLEAALKPPSSRRLLPFPWSRRRRVAGVWLGNLLGSVCQACLGAYSAGLSASRRWCRGCAPQRGEGSEREGLGLSRLRTASSVV